MHAVVHYPCTRVTLYALSFPQVLQTRQLSNMTPRTHVMFSSRICEVCRTPMEYTTEF